ncbi:MAG: hypothetical protein WC227_04055 [Patescibacteria group bacterium]|jgi:hypothetical protein
MFEKKASLGYSIRMDERKPQFLAKDTENLLEEYRRLFTGAKNLERDNDKTIGTALVYEKLRVAVEYQEEHLVFKNAITRILRRKYALSPSITAENLFSDLISELAWANYLNPEKLVDSEVAAIKTVIERYLTVLHVARSGRFKKQDLQRKIIDWFGCALDEIFRPEPEKNLLIDFTYNFLKKNLDLTDSKVLESDNELQLKIVIYNSLFKPDYPLAEYWILEHVYPNWNDMDLEELKGSCRSFDPFYNKIERVLNHPLRKNYQGFTKRFIPPFILLKSVLSTKNFDLQRMKDKPSVLHDAMMHEYDILVKKGREKVMRGTIRALIFIFITKISLAFFVEVPFDKFFAGHVDYTSLIINVSLPPILMLLAGTFIKTPPAKNQILIAKTANEIISGDKILEKPVPLVSTRKPTSFIVFNAIYTLLTLTILAMAIWLLLWLKFNIVSIFFFFFFVSVVSFFSFRIRNIALELAMKRSRDDAITTIVELAFLPFIKIGRHISDRFAAFNPAILFLDFIIEAPLKTIIKLLNSWLKFVNNKKEEMEY